MKSNREVKDIKKRLETGPSMKAYLKTGWVVKEFYMYKMLPKRQLTIEFCIGDYCVGIFDDHKDLLEPKARCKTFAEAIITAHDLEIKHKYS